MSEAETSYDKVLYPIHSFAQTNPCHLETIGRIFGMEPAPATKCRVLEIGCASGGNLLPMAEQFPDSSFVGVDYAAKQIEIAEKLRDAAELSNVELKNANILEFGEDEGTFDYIIVHGIYSWVPDEVKEKILSICSANLSENGIAYVSYNTFPGWRLKGMLRDMMLYHTQSFETPADKVAQAKALAKFLAEAVEGEDTAYAKFLGKELEEIKKYRDNYIFHDALEEVNDPCYFHEFHAKADQNELQYLGEASLGTMLTQLMKKDVADTLGRITNNIIAREQYMDFVRNRQFRQTLLCRKGVTLNRNIDPNLFRSFKVRTSLKPVSASVNLAEGAEEEFKLPNDKGIKSGSSLAKAFLNELSMASPESLTCDDALERAKRSIEGQSSAEQIEKSEPQLLAFLLRLFCGNMLSLSASAPSCVSIPSEKPALSTLARAQAANGLTLTNRYHSMVNFDILGFKLAALLDGSNDRDAIVAKLVEEAKGDSLNISQEGKKITDEETLEKILRFRVEQLLHSMAANALLVA